MITRSPKPATRVMADGSPKLEAPPAAFSGRGEVAGLREFGEGVRDAMA